MNKAYARKRDDYGRPPSLHEISLSLGDIVRSHLGEIRERRRDRKARERNGQLARNLIDLQFNPAVETAGNPTSENINHKQEIW